MPFIDFGDWAILAGFWGFGFRAFGLRVYSCAPAGT